MSLGRITLAAGLAVALVALSRGTLPAEEPSTLPVRKPEGPRYSLPYPPGSEFQVGQGYGDWPTHVGQYAIDWTMPEETPLLAARAGVVIEAIDTFSKSGLTEEMKPRANRVVIRHDDGTLAMYVHLAHDSLRVTVGQRVAEGEEIALSGNTGFSATPHLHFMVYRLAGGQIESFPVLFKSGTEEPYAIYRGAKYRAPGGTPAEEEGPLKGVQGTGELASIRPRLVQLVKQAPDPEQGAIQLKEHLLRNRKAYHELYRQAFARSQAGDKSAMKELQDVLNSMDLSSEPAIARLLLDDSAANTANEALLVWWELFALP